MKSQSYILCQVLRGILLDAKQVYPHKSAFDRDIERVSLLVKDRGIAVFTTLLPHLDANLLIGLRDGRLPSAFPLSKRIGPKSTLPRFLSGLWSRIFDRNGCLLEEPDVNAIFFIRSISNLGKKLIKECSPRILERTLNDYRHIDEGLRKPTLCWQSDTFGSLADVDNLHFCDHIDSGLRSSIPLFEEYGPTDDASASDKRLLRQFQDSCDYFAGLFESFNPFSEICLWKEGHESGLGFRHGPGAVAHRSGIVDKFDFPNWTHKLSRVFSPVLFGQKALGDGGFRNHETPSRLVLVPKDQRGPRLIAAEPVENQWCQQLVRRYLERQIYNRIGKVFIDFTDQSKSNDLARAYSLSGDGSTVDLSSASDRLTCWTIERAFRKNKSLLNALQSVRTRYLVNKTGYGDWDYLIPRKYVTQGTATTFPVQTLIFLICAFTACKGSIRTEEDFKSLTGKVRVFGDDIIIPNQGYTRLCRLLHLLELKVNMNKSFNTGYFRESCGGDFYKGYNVTPIKPRYIDGTKPTARASAIDTVNNLFEAGLWNASEALRILLLPSLSKVAIKHPAVGLVGYSSFCGSKLSHLQKRVNQKLHYVEVKCHTFFAKEVRYDRQGVSRLRKFILERPSSNDNKNYHSDMLRDPQTRDGLRWVPHNLYDYGGQLTR